MKNVELREVGSRVPQLNMTQSGNYLQVCFLQSPVVLTYAQHHMPELEITYTTYTNGKDPSIDTQRDTQRDYLGIATLATHCTQLVICSKALHADCAPLKGNGFSTLASLVCSQCWAQIEITASK